MAVAKHCHPLSSSHWVACSSVTASPLRCRTGLSCGAPRLGKTATLVPSRWTFACKHMLDTGELMWTSVKRVGTRGIRPPAGAVENMRRLGLIRPPGPSPVTLSSEAARCWPSAGLCGGQHAVSSQVPWMVCGRLPLRGHIGPGPFRASTCPESSWRQGSHLPYTSKGLLRQQRHITIRKVPGWHTLGVPSATEVAVRAVLGCLLLWGGRAATTP